MIKPLSNDLRKRVVAAVMKGESSRAVASRYGVAVSSVVKWSQRYRAIGSVNPGQMGGHRTGCARDPCLAQRGVAVHPS